MHHLERIVVGVLRSNSYIFGNEDSKEAILVDAGDNADTILSSLRRRDFKLLAIFATHAHLDHVLAVGKIKQATGSPFLMHKDDLSILRSTQETARNLLGIGVDPPPRVDRYLTDGDIITLGKLRLKVIHTPGHTPGSVCLLGEKTLFSGDTLFRGTIGRTDFPEGDPKAIVKSIEEKLYVLEESTVVYPGHGIDTTIALEKETNPFVRGAS